jgi:fructokinase
MKYTIVGLGEILWDMLPSGKQMGGAPANFAYHAKELGLGDIKSRIVSSIGKDKLGDEILSNLASLFLDDKYISRDEKQHPTGTVNVTKNEEGMHSFTITKEVAWDYISDTDNAPSLEKLAKNANVVCFGSLAQRSPVSKKTVQSFLNLVRLTSKNALRIFDINLRQEFYSKEIIETSLHLANILKINDDELSTVAKDKFLSLNGNEESIMLKELAQRYNLQLVILTKGDKGSILYSLEQDKEFSHGGFPVNQEEGDSDTVGAGDAFTAAIAVGMLKNYDFDYINECANRVAAFVCSQAGATPKLPNDIKNLFRYSV